MTNLLPPLERKKIVRMYRMRAASAGLVIIGVSFLVGAVLLLPSLFLTESRKGSIEEQAKVIEDSISTRSVMDFESAIDLTRKKLLALPKENIFPSMLIEEILKEKPRSVSLSEFSFQRTGEQEGTLSIEGVAASRDTLVAFNNALEKNEYFIDVSLPISDLAANRDIQFSMTMRVRFES